MTPRPLLPAIGFFGLACALVGCGSKPTAPDVPPENRPQAPQPGATPGGPGAPAAGAGYELDPARHAIPSAPATGQLGGKPFTPNRVELDQDKLIFRFRHETDLLQGAGLGIALGAGRKADDGLKLVVRPDQKSPDVPMLDFMVATGEGPPNGKFVGSGYALTLELAKAEKGKSAGKIYLSLPGPEKSYLAGTFVIEHKRPLPETPGDTEVPFIQGKVTPALKKNQTIDVGYVGLSADGKVITDSTFGFPPFGDEGTGGNFRSTSSAPRAAHVRFEKFVPHFDFTNLPPGRYFVYARVVNGPTGWAWATVAANQRVTADLKLDEKNAGTVEVKISENSERFIRLVPADLGSPPPDEKFIDQLASSLNLQGDVKDGKATITNVPAGKYQIRTFFTKVEVQVDAGKTATVDLTPKK